MRYSYVENKNTVVAYLDSILDIGSSSIVQKELKVLIEQFPDSDFIVNMEQVEYINSAGLGALIVSAKKIRSSKRKFKITNLNDTVKKVIEILDAQEIIDVYDNEEEAFESPDPS
jgi:anti-anti-sigma factor